MQELLDLNVVKDYLNKIDDNAYDLLKEWSKNSSIKNDEKLAEMMNQKVTIIRTTLNKLSFRGIITYEKEKDQNSGWYNFYWNINFKKLATLITKEHLERRDKLKTKLNQLQDYDFFTCNNVCKEIPFEIAAEYNFNCPHCNQNLAMIDKKIHGKKIVDEISQIEQDLVFIKKIYN